MAKKVNDHDADDVITAKKAKSKKEPYTSKLTSKKGKKSKRGSKSKK